MGQEAKSRQGKSLAKPAEILSEQSSAATITAKRCGPEVCEQEVSSSRRRVFRAAVCCAISLSSALLVSPLALAQTKPETPDEKYLFIEDKRKKEKKDKATQEADSIRKQKKQFDSLEKTGKLPFDISAKEINFDQNNRKLLADGGLIITYSSMVLEALKGEVDVEANQAKLSGDVRISDVSGTITAEEGNFNLKTGEGSLKNADVFLSAGEFKLQGEEIARRKDEIYAVKNGSLTTCQCAESQELPPWRIRVDEAEVKRNGYGEAWGATLDVFNVPVFYTPYLIFPAKTERQTGFLPFSIGKGRQSGFDLSVPFFWDISESADATITTVYESDIRVGLDNEFRKVFSRKSSLETGIIYFNESARNGKLLGTDVGGLSDPTIDENRFAAYLEQNWKGKAGSLPLQLVTDARYVSDDLIMREYENSHLGPYNSRYATSQAVLRAPLGTSFSADLMTEFNQAMIEDDERVLQRLPELDISGIQVFHPFGDNDLGAKLVSSSSFMGTNFSRAENYDGTRADFLQSLKVPFHYMNIFDAQVEGYARATGYSMDETNVLSSNSDKVKDTLPSSSDRILPGINAKISSVAERVYNLEEDNWLRSLGELGAVGRSNQLSRVKHTLEPGLKYKYVPYVDQSDNPQYDSIDHLAQKSVVTYQLTQRLFGRFEPRNPYLYGVEEAVPEVKTLGNLQSASPLDNKLIFGFQGDDETEDFQRLRVGSVRELGSFKLSQSYNFIEIDEGKHSSQSEDKLSDIAADLITYPNDYVYLRARSDFSTADQSLSSYLLETQLLNKRGDRFRARFRFIDPDVRQLESNVEVKLTDAVKFGYYTRYDDKEGEFLENKFGMRYYSSCKCWIFDVDFSDKVNPDETRVTFNVTFVGLGELNQHFFPTFDERKGQTTK